MCNLTFSGIHCRHQKTALSSYVFQYLEMYGAIVNLLVKSWLFLLHINRLGIFCNSRCRDYECNCSNWTHARCIEPIRRSASRYAGSWILIIRLHNWDSFVHLLNPQTAWYQSGYATGRYHTLRELELKQQARKAEEEPSVSSGNGRITGLSSV